MIGFCAPAQAAGMVQEEREDSRGAHSPFAWLLRINGESLSQLNVFDVLLLRCLS